MPINIPSAYLEEAKTMLLGLPELFNGIESVEKIAGSDEIYMIKLFNGYKTEFPFIETLQQILEQDLPKSKTEFMAILLIKFKNIHPDTIDISNLDKHMISLPPNTVLKDGDSQWEIIFNLDPLAALEQGYLLQIEVKPKKYLEDHYQKYVLQETVQAIDVESEYLNTLILGDTMAIFSCYHQISPNSWSSMMITKEFLRKTRSDMDFSGLKELYFKFLSLQSFNVLTQTIFKGISKEEQELCVLISFTGDRVTELSFTNEALKTLLHQSYDEYGLPPYAQKALNDKVHLMRIAKEGFLICNDTNRAINVMKQQALWLTRTVFKEKYDLDINPDSDQPHMFSQNLGVSSLIDLNINFSWR